MILACDIGLKRIGIAIYLNNIILPLQPILRKNRNQAARDLDLLLIEKKITTLIIGVPESQSIACQETKKRILFFCNLLKTEAQKIFIDEDYSSVEASKDLSYLTGTKKHLAHKDGKLDSLAACKILERYLSSLNASLITS